MIQTRFGRSARYVLFALATLASIASSHANLVWEDYYVDEQAVTNGSTVTSDGHTVTITTSVFSDNDGGTFDLTPATSRNADYFAFESSLTGNQPGNIELAFDNENDDPADYLQITLAFATPVDALSFSVLDLDASPSGFWDDAVEIYFDGTNIRTDASLYSLGSAIFLDNESYMFGFEGGSTPSSSTQTLGNINVDFGGTPVSTITIKYFSTDDANSNPSPQFVGISDLAYTAVPEPHGEQHFLFAALCALSFARRP